MRLFMQAGGATVELPNTSSADSVFTVSETVGFRDSVVVENPVSSVDSLEEDIWKSIDMDRIDIVAQRKSIERILERNGEVTLMFYVKAPKVLLDSCWKLTMYPELIEKDSSVLLSPVILRGKEFIRTQESQYKAYDDFLRGIIPESKYDSAFVDREGIRKDIFARQRLFWKVYEAERRRRLAYLRWKALTVNGVSIASPTVADYDRGRVIHSVSGLKRGVGDICRLVGIPLNEINAKLAAGILPDNGTWRLPTANELAALLHPFQDSSQGRVYSILNNTFFPYNAKYGTKDITYPTAEISIPHLPSIYAWGGLIRLGSRIAIRPYASTAETAIRCIRQ